MLERVVIFGGAGNMGRLIDTEAQKQGHETKIVDPKAEIQIDPEGAIAWATVLYFSLFAKDLLSVLDQHGQSIRPDQIVLENTSAKTIIIEALRELDRKGTSVCSVHPLAKHDQPPQGQKVVIMPIGAHSDKARTFAEDFYDRMDMIITYHNLKDHDPDMTPEQLPWHSINRAHLLTFRRLGYKFAQLWNLAPANAELGLASVARTGTQDPKISATIIHNYLKTPEGKAWKATFMGSLEEILSTGEKGEEELAVLLSQTNEYLREDGMDQQMNEATTVILEGNANLRLQSITIHSPSNEPGVLAAIATAFAENNVNLNLVRNRPPNEGVELVFGVDRNTDLSTLNQAIIRIKELGFEVRETHKEK